MARDPLQRLIDQAAAEGWTALDLGRNQLRKLPPEIGQLTNLRQLNLGSNQLSTLPPEIGQLIHLRQLDLRSNQMRMLPPEIGRLTKLQQLDLSYNQLRSLPPEIGQLINLQKLDLGSNQLSILPPEIRQLTNLQQLDLFNNQLQALLPEIRQLIHLQQLDLSYNQLRALPPEIRQLIHLQQLDLVSNQLSVLPPEIGHLTHLQQLDLIDNQLRALPPEIGQLTHLQQLDLVSNQLSVLPPEIGQLTHLQQLDLVGNQLNALPPEIGRLQKLEKLELYGNQFEDPPPEIVWEGTQSVLNYLRQQLEQGKDYVYEAKLIIVGEGGAGKTSLAKKIVDPSYELDSHEVSTEGIDVIRWDFELPDGTVFRTNIWDFGGQEIYHATHQFFLTKRSLYALVVDTRQDNTDFYYWLSIVELLSDSSPVFIVKNEKQDRHCDVNEGQLRGEFNNFRETLATNLKTNRGLDEIRRKIQQYITDLPHVGTRLPKKWVDIRRALETDQRNYISLVEYYRICEANGFTHQADQLQLSEYLHDLGVCLHFQKDPILKHTVILKPEWGTAAVYKALDTKEIYDNLGRFTRTHLDIVWSDDEYADMRDELLQLMMRFKLCYQIPGTDDQYIAPQLLSSNKPAYNWDEPPTLLLRYRYGFMPKGILTRFIVEMHKFIAGQRLVWKSGVVLNNGSAQAEIIELYHKGEIHIRVCGKRPKDLVTVIIHEVDKINDSYDRMRVNKLIPCQCDLWQAGDAPQFFPLNVLHRFIDKGQEKIQCQKCFEMVDVRQLILGFSDPVYDPEADKNDYPPLAESSSFHPENCKDSWPIQTLQDDPMQRIKLFDTLSNLATSDFEKLVFALDAPRGNLGEASTPQGERVSRLLDWAKSNIGCGLDTLENALQAITSNA
ncbi:MAG: leucine-rich repeat domain-containing protein [Leptolyngbya sp. SIO1E4]|nr:leucine-rich repeat domain-containing protein [Leptolyngbya sp. SIO1E4]